jgi:hypothetical protein
MASLTGNCADQGNGSDFSRTKLTQNQLYVQLRRNSTTNSILPSFTFTYCEAWDLRNTGGHLRLYSRTVIIHSQNSPLRIQMMLEQLCPARRRPATHSIQICACTGSLINEGQPSPHSHSGLMPPVLRNCAKAPAKSTSKCSLILFGELVSRYNIHGSTIYGTAV